MDLNFTCDKCGQELTADDSMVGVEIECPACHQAITIPGPGAAGGMAEPAEYTSSHSSSGEPRMSIPLTSKGTADMIQKSTARPLNIAAKEELTVFCRTILRSECGDTKKFDEQVSRALNEIGRPHIMSTHAVREKDGDFGIVILYEKI